MSGVSTDLSRPAPRGGRPGGEAGDAADVPHPTRRVVDPKAVDRGDRPVTAEDFKGLQALAELAGRRFHRGLVLHLGRQAAAFGPNLHAVPLTVLWEWWASGRIGNPWTTAMVHDLDGEGTRARLAIRG